MGPAVAAAVAALLALAEAGLPPCSLGSRGSSGRRCAETRALSGQAAALALRGWGAGQRARDPGSAAGSRRRAKRGLTYPGTLWCGAGNIADSYEQLGEHQETDKCCREHDHCQHLIYPFTYKYGYRNLRWHTISHCDCDRRLKDCLDAVNDTAARVVGQAFFNVIQVPCFELAYKEACVESYLYVWCRNYSTVAVAVLHDPVMFDYGGEPIDAPATRRPPPPASSTTVPPTTTFRPAGGSTSPPPRKPGQTAERWPPPGPRARPSSLPPKPRKGKGKERRGRKGKGAKQQRKGARAEAGPPAAPLRPTGPGATISLKQLAGQEPRKGGVQAPGGQPEVGRGDSFNAILSDEPGGGGAERGAGAPPESMQTILLKDATPGPSGGRRKRKRRRKLQKEEATLPRQQQPSMPGRDWGEQAGARRDG